MPSFLTGFACWDACEAAAKAKRPKLGPEYKICSIESLPHNSQAGFEVVWLRLGRAVIQEDDTVAWFNVTKLIALTAGEVEAAAKGLGTKTLLPGWKGKPVSTQK